MISLLRSVVQRQLHEESILNCDERTYASTMIVLQQVLRPIATLL